MGTATGRHDEPPSGRRGPGGPRGAATGPGPGPGSRSRTLRAALTVPAVVLAMVAGAGAAVTAAGGSGSAAAWPTALGVRAQALLGTAGQGDEPGDEGTPERTPDVVTGDVPITVPSPTTVPSSAPRRTLPPGLTEDDVEAGLLAADVPQRASGDLEVVAGSDPGPGEGEVVRVRVEVEKGLPVDGAVFADAVMSTLNDARGWGADGSLSFARVEGRADLRVVLASPDEVDALCAPLQTEGTVSCGRRGRAVVNFARWARATEEFPDRVAYRQYVVNHEVGHLLGHPHERCPGAGRRAPVMQQQTLAVAPCTPNPWPNP